MQRREEKEEGGASTFDALEHLPDLLLAAMAVDGHPQHEGLQIQERMSHEHATQLNSLDGRARNGARWCTCMAASPDAMGWECALLWPLGTAHRCVASWLGSRMRMEGRSSMWLSGRWELRGGSRCGAQLIEVDAGMEYDHMAADMWAGRVLCCGGRIVSTQAAAAYPFRS